MRSTQPRVVLLMQSSRPNRRARRWSLHCELHITTPARTSGSSCYHRRWFNHGFIQRNGCAARDKKVFNKQHFLQSPSTEYTHLSIGSDLSSLSIQVFPEC